MTDAGDTSAGHVPSSAGTARVTACFTCCPGDQRSDARLDRPSEEALAEEFKSDQGLAAEDARQLSLLPEKPRHTQEAVEPSQPRMALVEVQQVCPIFEHEPDDEVPPAEVGSLAPEYEWVPKPRASIVQAMPRKRNSISIRPPPPRGLVARKLGDRYDSAFIHCTRRVITSRAWDVASMLVVLCALFLTDIYGVAQAPENTSLDLLLMGCFFFFLAELLANTLTVESYLNSFFFWMDIIGTASIIFDISMFLGRDVTQRERSGEQAVGSENACDPVGRAVLLVRRSLPVPLGQQSKRHVLVECFALGLELCLGVYLYECHSVLACRTRFESCSRESRAVFASNRGQRQSV
ncbi:PDE9A [Symbiodinium natans]|uniref:PDE9A protein n=1 Tax=Symbiodinium natans TaxID=878477 RepID=A0A812K5Q3_9DINO|nr:PDE9A [Symbiodinium natans]